MQVPKGLGVMGAALLALIALCPISRAEEAKATGQATWIGVTVRPLSDALRSQWEYRGAGVMVTAVAPGSAAEMAGIVRGDVLVVLGSVSLRSESDFSEAQARLVPGEPVSVVIAREKGRIINIVNLDVEEPPIPSDPAPPVTSEAQAPEAVATVVPSPAPAAPPTPAQKLAFGVRAEPLSPALAAALGVSVEQGVIVLAVESGSPAERSGIHPGDVISRVADQSVRSADEMEKAFSLAAAAATVRIHRQREERDVEVQLVQATPPAEVETPRDAERDRLIEELRAKVRELRMEIIRLKTELEDVKSGQSSL
jgi:S1-C subfamily serine protease